MMFYAKVSQNAVMCFQGEVDKSIDCIKHLDAGVANVQELETSMTRSINLLKLKLPDIDQALPTLKTKANSLKTRITSLSTQRQNKKALLDRLEIAIRAVPKYLQDEEGKRVRNPDYDDIQSEIKDLKDQIAELNEEIYRCKERLKRCDSLEKELRALKDTVKEDISLLQSFCKKCQVIREQILKIKTKALKNSEYALDRLDGILNVIFRYLEIKMEFDSSVLDLNGYSERNIEGYSQADVYNKQQNISDHRDHIYSLSKEEILQHNVKFDEYGRIREYDGRTFGGKYKTYEERLKSTPNDPNKGRYLGERGESMFVPSDSDDNSRKVKEKLAQHGLQGIIYRNAEPDFEDCAEAVVKINNMTENRHSNFSQADMILAEQWNKQKKDNRDDWTGRTVDKYRHENGLSWHEKSDAETMVLIDEDIHSFFRHSGGVAECGARDCDANSGGEFDD